MIVRPLTVEELPRCEVFAQEFYAEKQLLGDFQIDLFIQNWTRFLTTMPAVMFGLWEGEQLVGGLGAIVAPDLYDGRLCASELFWFVTKAYRTGQAWQLVEAFEAWGNEQNVDEYRMAHLLLPDEDPATIRLAPLYKRKGYRALDVSYVKHRKRG